MAWDFLRGLTFPSPGSSENPGKDCHPFIGLTHHTQGKGISQGALTWGWKSWLPLAKFPSYTCSFHLSWTKRRFDEANAFKLGFWAKPAEIHNERLEKKRFFLSGKLNNSLQVQWRLWDDCMGHLQNLYIQIWKKLIVLEDVFLHVDCCRVLQV